MGVLAVEQQVKYLLLLQLWCRSQLQLRFDPELPCATVGAEKGKSKQKNWMMRKSREKREVVDSMREIGHGESHLKSKLNLNRRKLEGFHRGQEQGKMPSVVYLYLTLYRHTHTHTHTGILCNYKKEKGRYL